jgi:hypothetical protein
MRAAAERWRGTTEALADGLRVGAATVRVTEAGPLCDCPMASAPVCLHRLVASGRAPGAVKAVETCAPPPTKEAPRERLTEADAARFAPVLAEVEALIAEILTVGLTRAARGTGARVKALSARATALGRRRKPAAAGRDVGLGRLARTLDRLAVSLDALAGSDAGEAAAAALGELAVARNLVRALRANTGALPLAEIAGSARSEYLEVPALEVQGLGLEAWKAPGRAAGVTAYVAVIGEDRVLARTAVAPASPGPDVRAWAEPLARGPAFAASGVTLRDLSRGRFTLTGARIAPGTGRLSGSAATNAAERTALPHDAPELRPFVLASASDAARFGRKIGFDPLGRARSSLPLALLPVRALAPSDFDAVTQRLILKMELASGRTVTTSLPFREDRALWFDNLEELSRAAAAPRWLLVRLARDADELSVEPLTAHVPGRGTFDLTVDALVPGREGAA